MKVVVAGGTGFLGRPLCQTLVADGHEVVILTRSPSVAGFPSLQWSPDGTVGAWASAADGADAVVNLVGVSIAGRRWTAAHKAEMVSSRVQSTRSLAAAIRAASRPPRVFIGQSAIGYYGDRGDEILTERSSPGSDFLARLCIDWEAAANEVASPATRVAVIRTGIVLERDGGALGKLLPPFKLFVGGSLGAGRQYMSWIHRADWIGLVRWALHADAATGPLNATAPSPVRNVEFARALGRVLGRPSFLPTPAFALRLMLGEMSDPLLLYGQRVLPARAKELGFRFQYTDLDQALKSILER